MQTSEKYIIDVNKRQKVGETDSFTPKRYQQFYRHLPKGCQKILDVGCSTGRGGAVLKSLNPSLKIVGLDCVKERIDALDCSVYSDSLCCFTDNIEAPDRLFDAILAGEFLEHVPPKQIDATLAELFRILKLNGRFILTTPNPHYLKNRFKGLSILSDPAHVTQHYPEILKIRLMEVGFSRIKVLGTGRVSNLLGPRFPWLSVYGSYLISCDKW